MRGLPSVIREVRGGLCTLTLNRPEKLNALDTQAFVELDEHLAWLESSRHDIGCVMLRGNGRAFCSGADLAALGAKPVPPEFKPGVIRRLGELPQPVVVAVHGICFTGGLELALAGDFILADRAVRFADTHGKWGVVSQWGMSQRLPRRVGHAAAKRLMMTGCEISAEEALGMGLIDMLAERDLLDDLAASFIEDILNNSWHTNFAAKRVLRESEGMSLSAGLDYERDCHPGFAPDYQDRIRRFKK